MKVLKNILFSIVVFCLFFGLAELWCRLITVPDKFVYKKVYEYDKDKIFRLKKNIRGHTAGKPCITNSFGFRDYEIPLEKPENTIRILVVGDSITYGHEVYSHETYPKQLEKILNESNKGYHFNVINTAACGNSTFQEYYDLKRGLKFKPDIAIIQFALNDVTEPYEKWKRYGGKGIDYHDVQEVPYLYYLLSQHSSFFTVLKKLIARVHFMAASPEELKEKAKRKEIYKATNLVEKPDEVEIQAAWDECLNWMQKLVDLCHKKEIDCILVASPFRFQIELDDSKTYPQKILERFAHKNKIMYIDLLELLKEEIRQKIVEKHSLQKDIKFIVLYSEFEDEIKDIIGNYFFDHSHYDPSGHKFIARNIYPKVEFLLNKRGLSFLSQRKD